MEKALGNHSTVFPKKSWQFQESKEKESLESHDFLYSEGAWHLFQEESKTSKMTPGNLADKIYSL